MRPKEGNDNFRSLEPKKKAERRNEHITNKRVINVPTLSTKNLAMPCPKFPGNDNVQSEDQPVSRKSPSMKANEIYSCIVPKICRGILGTLNFRRLAIHR